MNDVIGDPSLSEPSIKFGSRITQNLTYGIGHPLLSAFVKGRVEGREHIENLGAFVLAANHRSHFDPPLLTWALERWVDWAAMSELYRNPWMAKYWRALAAISVDRSRLDRRAAVAILQRLRAGRVVGIFPERGIRTAEDSVLAGGALDAGACRLALAARVPLVPAVILGSERMYSAGGWLFPRQAFRVVIRIGEPLLPGQGEGSDRAAADALNERLAAALRRLAGQGER